VPNKPSLITISSSIKGAEQTKLDYHIKLHKNGLAWVGTKPCANHRFIRKSLSPKTKRLMKNKNNLIQSYTHASNQASRGEEELACLSTTGTLQHKTQNPRVDLYVFIRIYVCRKDTRTSSYPWANNALNCAPRSLVLSCCCCCLAMVSFLPLLLFLYRISFSLSLFSFLMNFLEKDFFTQAILIFSNFFIMKKWRILVAKIHCNLYTKFLFLFSKFPHKFFIEKITQKIATKKIKSLWWETLVRLVCNTKQHSKVISKSRVLA